MVEQLPNIWTWQLSKWPNLHVPFLVMLDILFLLIKKYHEIEGTEMFERYFLYIAYVDDATFSLKGSQSIAHLVEIFNTFPFFQDSNQI